MEYKSVIEVLEHFGREKVAALGKDLPNSADATGELRGSIRFRIKVFGFGYNFQIALQDYYVWVDQGRKPGKFPPISKIEQWIKDKQISVIKGGKLGLKTRGNSDRFPTDRERKSLAFLFARKIAKEGTKPTNFYSKNINKKAIDILVQDLQKGLKTDTIEFIRIL